MEKDWVVVLYGEDPVRLAAVNANVRTIDLVRHERSGDLGPAGV
jgi:hypothetical protein